MTPDEFVLRKTKRKGKQMTTNEALEFRNRLVLDELDAQRLVAKYISGDDAGLRQEDLLILVRDRIGDDLKAARRDSINKIQSSEI